MLIICPLLYSQGPGTKIDLGTQTKGILPLAKGGTGAMTAAGAWSNILSTVAGPANFPTLVNDGTTDNVPTSTPISGMNTSLALGGWWIMPSNLQGLLGNIAYSNTLQVSQSGTILDGSGWGVYANKATQLTFTGSGPGITANCQPSGANCDSISFRNFNIQASNSATATVGIQLTGPNNASNGDFASLENILIKGFPQCMTTKGYGNNHIGQVVCYGTTNSTGLWLVDFAAGSMNSSAPIGPIRVVGNTAYTTAVPTMAGCVRVQDGFGTVLFLGDTGGCLEVLRVGNWAISDFANITAFIGDNEARFGPIATVDTSSTATIYWGGDKGNTWDVDAPFIVNNNGLLVLINPLTPPTQPPVFKTVVPSSSGGTYANGSTICFAYEGLNSTTPDILLGVSTPLNTGPSAASCTTFSSGTAYNSVALTMYPLGNLTRYNIYAGPTSTTSTMSLIANQSGTTYVSTGSESPGAAPLAANIPLVREVGASSVTRVMRATQGGGGLSIGNLVMKSSGELYNPDTPANVVAYNAIPTPSTLTRGNFYLGLQPAAVNGTDQLIGKYCSYASSVQTCSSSINLFTAIGAINSFADATTGTAASWIQTGIGTNLPLVNIATSNASALAFPLALSTGSLTGYLLRMTDGNSTTNYGFLANQFVYPHTFNLLSLAAATNGTNVSSPPIFFSGNAYSTTASLSENMYIQQQAVLSNTAQTPTDILTYTCHQNVNLATTCGANFTGLTNGVSLPGDSTGHGMCWKAGGIPGYCSTVLDSSGNCTCN